MKTVKDLKKFLESVPENTPIAGINNLNSDDEIESVYEIISVEIIPSKDKKKDNLIDALWFNTEISNNE